MPYTLKGSLLVNSQLVINGSTSGDITFNAPATAGTQNYTWPTAYPGTTGFVLISDASGVMTWAAKGTGGGTGTVTTVSVVSANGFAGTVATPTSTPAITLTTNIGTSGTPVVLQGNGTAIQALGLTTAVTTNGFIGGTSFVLRDTQATPNTITIKAPTAFTSGINLQFPGALVPTKYLGADTSGIMYWNYPMSTSYTSPSSIAVGDIFAGVPATSKVTFGQYFEADNSAISCVDAEFNAKMWPSIPTVAGASSGGYFNMVGYSNDTVNGVAPTYQYLCVPAVASRVLLSNDGVNWVESSGAIFSGGSANWNPPVRAVFGAVGSQTSLWLATQFASPTAWYQSLDEGQTWALYATPPGTAFTTGIGQAYYTPNTPGNQRLWLLNRGGTTTTALWYTTNGTTWTAVTTTITQATGMVAGPGTYPNQTLVLSGVAGISVSTDSGATWSAVVVPTGATAGIKVSYNATTGVYTAVQPTTTPLYWTSTDGSTWTSRTVPTRYGAVVTSGTNQAVPLANGAVAALFTTAGNTFDFYGLTAIVYYDGVNSAGSKIISTLPITTDDGIIGGMNSMPNDELWFVGTHQANFVAIMKKSIYIEDGLNFTKAPLGTYKCLGKAGTATNSFLWQRVV